MGKHAKPKDERGSVISVANASGQLLAINSYDAYGLAAPANGSTPTPAANPA